MNTSKIKAEILQKVQDYVIKKIEIAGSQNEAAKQLGISPAHLINFRKGDWEKVSQKGFNQMLALAGLSGWKPVMTDNLKIAYAILQEAQDNSRFLVLTGATGFGKTTTCRLYADKTSKAYYLHADSEMNKSRFLLGICQAVGVSSNDAGTNSGQRLNAICNKLNSEEKPLLIVDDAGKLSDTNLRMMQIIYDRTEGRAGILLAGTEFLKKNIDKKARQDKMGFRELRRRVAYWQELETIPMRDVRAICEQNGIIDTQAIKYLTNSCKDFGTLKNMITNALKLSEKEKVSVTRELLTQMNGNRDWWQGAAA